MTFKDKTFDDRKSDEMWHHSEDFFEKLWPGPWARYGLGHEDDDMLSWRYDPFILHTPDYRAAVHDKATPVLVEVQGTGTNAKVRTHKFKQLKLDTLGKWNRHHEVTFWLWDDKEQSSIWTSYVSIRMAIGQGMATKGMFDGKRPYWALPVDTVRKIADTERLMELYG